MRVLVISYDLMDRVRDRLQKENKGAVFQVIIADECHMLKNQNTKRSKAILPMLKVRSSDQEYLFNMMFRVRFRSTWTNRYFHCYRWFLVSPSLLATIVYAASIEFGLRIHIWTCLSNKTARRAILLSGTPALSRPKELWSQLNVM